MIAPPPRLQRVLVTGGAGFVGSNLVEALLDRDPPLQVRVLDDLFTGRLENLPTDPRVDFVEGTVTDEALVGTLVREADLVLHLAARNIIVSTANPREDYGANIGGTLNILLAAREHGRKVVYTSSASVYGNPRYLPVNEDDAISTLSPYAVSKLAGENYCYAFYETYGLPTAVVRYSNVYGPRQSPLNPYCGVVAKFMDWSRTGQALVIHGDGEQTRDYTFVRDAVEATLAAAFRSTANGQCFNIGTGIETSVNRLAETIQALYQFPNPATHVDRRDIDNIRRRVLNIEKIRRVLRWVPTHTLRTGLEATKVWLDASYSSS